MASQIPAKLAGNPSRIDTASAALAAGTYSLNMMFGFACDETRTLMEAAHQVCPYSSATRGNIEVKVIAD